MACVAAIAQPGARELTVWSSHLEATDEADVYRVIFTGKIEDGYHTYTLTDEFSATEFMDVNVSDCELVGEPYEISTPKDVVDEFGDQAKHYYGEIIIAQNIKVTGPAPVFSGTIFTNTCNTGSCQPGYHDFSISVNAAHAVMPIESGQDDADGVTGSEKKSRGHIWALILEAILWGFAMLLTPCVFPMVPMTVSFFM